MLTILYSSKYKFELTLKTFIEGQDQSGVFWFRTWLLSWASSQLSLLFLLFFLSRKKASFSRSMLGFSRLAIKTTLWRVCTLRQRRYTSGQSHLDIKQQISRHLYRRRNTSFSVHLWNRVLFGAAVMYKQGWRYVGCRPSLLSSPHSSLVLSCYLQLATGVYCVINLLPCQSAQADELWAHHKGRLNVDGYDIPWERSRRPARNVDKLSFSPFEGRAPFACKIGFVFDFCCHS